MTGWWLRTCRAARTRWDMTRAPARKSLNKMRAENGLPPILTQQERRDKRINSDRLIKAWFGEPRMPAIGDAGTIIATPEDLAEIGVADPVTRPGRRYEGRHRAMPDEPIRRLP